MGIRPAILRAAGRFALSLLPQTTVTGIDKAGSCEVRSKSFKLSSTPTSSGLLSCGGQTEAYWVLFRFLYGGQLADPSLIIHIDDVGWSAVSERFVQALIVPPVHPVQRGELNLCQ